jgi:hypothetical protein
VDSFSRSYQVAQILLDLAVAYEVGGDHDENARIQNLAWDRIGDVSFTASLNPDGKSAQLDPKEWLGATQYLLFLAVHELAARADETQEDVVAMLRGALDEPTESDPADAEGPAGVDRPRRLQVLKLRRL